MNPQQGPQPPAVTTPFISQGSILDAPSNNFSSNGFKTSKKNIFAIVALLVFVIGTGAGAVLIGNPLTYFSKAHDCGKYTFSLSNEGIATVNNGSTRNEPFQRATVYINGGTVATFDVPALNSGASATLGVVSVPETSYTWQIQGTTSCQNSGRYDVQTSYRCQDIKAYSSNGTTLSATELSNLNSGDKIRLVAHGSGVSANYKAARFKINGTQQSETTLKMSTSGDYYMEYIIPANTKNFSVTAELKATDDKWY